MTLFSRADRSRTVARVIRSLASVSVLALAIGSAPACAPAPLPAPVCPRGAPVATAPSATAPPPASPSTLPASPPAPPPERPPPREPPAAFKQALDAARRAIVAGDLVVADRQIAAAAAAAGDDTHLAFLAAYHRAARFAYAGDFERAAASFVAVLPELSKHSELPDEFWAHNSMMMIREAQGDPAAALAENDQATLAAERGTWAPAERATLAFLKDRWHRAYLTRMLAEMRTGSAKQALVAYAESALADYRARARPLGEYEDSVAVLEAYFAALDGRPEDALRAAKRVDPSKDDDLEDLYLVVVGLEAGRDHAAAEAVRRTMRQPGDVHLSRAIMLRWLDLDAQPAAHRAFTPWHPAAR